MTEWLVSENLKVDYLPEMVQIHISGKKNIQQLSSLWAWLLFALVVWGFMFMIGYQVFSGISRERTFNPLALCMIPTLIMAILVWGIQIAFGVYVIFWQRAGLEILEVSHAKLKIKRTIFGIGRTWEYTRDRITSIQLRGEAMMPFAFLKSKSAMILVPIAGQVAIGFRAKEKEYFDQLGLGLTQAQAEKVVGILRKQLFPEDDIF